MCQLWCGTELSGPIKKVNTFPRNWEVRLYSTCCFWLLKTGAQMWQKMLLIPHSTICWGIWELVHHQAPDIPFGRKYRGCVCRESFSEEWHFNSSHSWRRKSPVIGFDDTRLFPHIRRRNDMSDNISPDCETTKGDTWNIDFRSLPCLYSVYWGLTVNPNQCYHDNKTLELQLVKHLNLSHHPTWNLETFFWCTVYFKRSEESWQWLSKLIRFLW